MNVDNLYNEIKQCEHLPSWKNKVGKGLNIGKKLFFRLVF